MSQQPTPAFDVYLASRSPRRQALLSQIGVRYRLLDVTVPEEPAAGEAPAAYVRRVAGAKAAAGLAASARDRPVLGADTDVVVDGRILGKPVNGAAARAMLRALSGRTHHVLSAVAVATPRGVASRLQVSEVTFAPLDESTIEGYVATGEPLDKAGAYAIQGLGAAFVAHLAGSFSGVMGLPLHETVALLREHGVDPFAAGRPALAAAP